MPERSDTLFQFPKTSSLSPNSGQGNTNQFALYTKPRLAIINYKSLCLVRAKTFFQKRINMYLKKTIVFTILFILIILQANAQGTTHSGHSTGQEPFPINSYTELKNPIATNLSDWKNVSKTNISWGSIDVRYKKEVPPPIKNNTKSINLTGWRGERVSAQFVVWSNKPLMEVTT